MSKDEKECVIPDVIYDSDTGKSYLKGRFFGKVSKFSCHHKNPIQYVKNMGIFLFFLLFF